MKPKNSENSINYQHSGVLSLNDMAKHINCYDQWLTSEGIRLLKLFKI